MNNMEVNDLIKQAKTAQENWPDDASAYLKTITPEKIVELGEQFLSQCELLERATKAMEYLIALANDPFPSPEEALITEIRSALYANPLPHTLYKCKTDGKNYEMLGQSTGAGTCKGQSYYLFRDITTGELYHLTEHDSWQHMEPFRESRGSSKKT